jgi:hypothetical protein
MAYTPILKEKVKAAWLSGNYSSGETIAKEFGIVRVKTIYDWAQKHKWGNFREQVAQRIAEKVVNGIADWQIKQAKVGQFMQTKGINKLRGVPDNEIPVDEARQLITSGSDIERKALTFGREDNPNVTVNFVNLWKIAESREEKERDASK